MIRVRPIQVASFLLLAATFPAAAAEVASNAQPQATATAPAAAPVAVAATPTASQNAPWAGSALTYGTSSSAYSFYKGADPFYDPSVSHKLDLAPQWKLNDLFFLRARLELSQELTVGDTEYVREVVLSDTTLDVATTGWKEPVSGLKITGDVRFTAPTSKVARFQSKIFSVGPRVGVSRSFDVRKGLTLAYEGRYTRRFYEYTTSGYDGPKIPNCGDPEGLTCQELVGTGRANVREDIGHGPTVMFQPIDKLSVTGVFRLMHGFLYPLSEIDIPVRENPYARDSRVKTNALFSLAASYPVMKFLELSAGATTFTPYPDSTGGDRNPFFNRYTTLYLDLGVDLEALLSRS